MPLILIGINMKAKAMAEQNANIVRRFFEEVWNNNNLSLVDELLASDFVDHSAPPGTPGGIEGYKKTVAMFRSAFPNIQFTLDHILAEGDRVAIRLTGRGTHKGNFMGIAPTGKQVSFSGMTFIRLRDGKITERWGISDMPGLMQQLGAGGPGAATNPPARANSSKGEVVYMAPDASHSTTRVLGVYHLCKATKDDTRGIYSFFVSTVPAGEGVPLHVHLKEDEAYYILEGEFEIYDSTHHRTLTVGPDAYVYVPMGTEHGFKNVGKAPGRMILMITPGGLEGFFEGIGQVITDVNNPPPPPSGPPDFARAAQVAAKYNVTFVVPEGGH